MFRIRDLPREWVETHPSRGNARRDPGTIAAYSMRSLAQVLLGLLLSCPLAQAEEVRARGWVHLNGYTHHFDAPDANDNVFGLGVTWHTRKWGRVVEAWEADVFRDSGYKLSAYAGYSWAYRMPYLNAGVTGALMYHRNFARQNPWSVLPVGLPFLEMPRQNFSVRAYYIPPVRHRCDHQIAFQMLVPFAR